MWRNLQVDVMLHQSHASISGPALLVVVTYNVLIVRVRMLSQVPLNQIPGLISRKSGIILQLFNNPITITLSKTQTELSQW